MESLSQLLSDVSPTPASYIRTAREIESASESVLRPLRVTVLSSFTCQILRPYIIVEGARRGMHLEPHFCPFNQLETQALNPNSELYKSKPEVIVLALRLEDALPELATRYTSLSRKQVDAALNGYQERLQTLIEGIRLYSDAILFVFNLSLPQTIDAGFADARLEIPQTSAVHLANQSLARLCQRQTAVYTFDYASLVYRLGIDLWHDTKLLYTARIPFGKEAQLALGRELARYIRAAFYPPFKCLVLDLDNTLWGGVLGEDGLGGIALGEDYPGNVYKAFQRRLRSLRDQGVFLAVASKNNETDVADAFNNHPDMLLKFDDFAAVQIHWNDKAGSLSAISKELNIGLEAIAFFDDSPFERELIKRNLPEVAVIDVPTDPAAYIKAIDESGLFDRLIISAEDRMRSDTVRETRKRDQLRSQATSVDDFLRALNMVATIGELSDTTLPRIAQLLSKTNQFNLTTRRHSSAQLQEMVSDGAVALWLRLKDRFGDSGLVGVAIAVPEHNGYWRIDSFLLSCRVIGRQAETALLAVLAQRLIQRGATVLIGEYIPTLKNQQVAGFYADHGFQSTDADGHRWLLNLSGVQLRFPETIQIDEAREEPNA